MQRQKGNESLRKAVSRLDEKLWHHLERVWQLAKEGIHDAQHSKDGHQQGTPHCRAVEDNLSALISDDWKGTRFSATDLFILSAAAALHDVGKAGDSPGDHGHVSMWEVRSRAESFGLDQGQAEVVGWIVRAHNDGKLDELPAYPVPLGTVEVNPRPLAALFKLADALHTDYRRVSPQITEFGGKDAHDNPKTLFRLRVRGWRFDEQGRIELYAVPKDWPDVDVIHTGLEYTRRELEPVIPALKDANLPHELTLRLDEADLEHMAQEHFTAQQRIERAFVGMDYFKEDDAPRFKGRDGDARSLWQRVVASPVTLLVGDSGVGKSSLICAGLFPLLHRARWRTAYARPLDDPDHFIIRDLWREILKEAPPTDTSIVDTLARMSRAAGSAKLLVVLDQFEDVARLLVPAQLDGLRRALVAVQAERFRNLRLLVTYRADAEAALGPFFQEASGSDRGLPRIYLQPLSRDGARAALEAGLAEAQVGVKAPLLDVIANELDAQTQAPGVYSPFVQMVGETLCRAAHDENEGILTEEVYRAKGGCSGIIGHYLLGRLAEFVEQEGAARKVLIALVRSTGVKVQHALDDVQAETGLAVDQLEPLLARLVNKRMVRRLGSGQYEIIHDHLALLVNQQIVNASERQLKELRELLDLKARAFATYHTLLMPEEMARLYAAREHILPTDDQMWLLLHSCLWGQGPAWFWLRDAPEDRYVPIMRDALSSPAVSVRRHAVVLLTEATRQAAIPDLREMLKDSDEYVRRAAVRTLGQVAGRDAIPDLREMLKDSDEGVLQAAVEALAQAAGQDAVPDLREMLKDSDEYVRRAAVEALAQAAGQDAVPDLRKMLEDSNVDVRQAAVEGLGQVAGRDAIPDLREMLKDSNEGVLQAAEEALGQVAGRADILGLREMLKDSNEDVRQVAVEALAKVAGRDAIPDLREMLKDSSGIVWRAAVRALARVEGREAIPDLREMLKDSDEYVRQVAVEALAHVPGRDAIPDLREMRKDSDEYVRRAVVEALGQVAGRDAIPDLREMRKDSDVGVREIAMKALVQVLKQVAIPDLREMLKDSDEYVRWAAVQALAQVAGRDVIPDLREMRKDSDESVQWEAMEALAQVAGRDAIPDLRELLQDSYSKVRLWAMKALESRVAQEDLVWLTDLVIHNSMTEAGEAANQLLIRLDRKLYCPFPIFAKLEEQWAS